MSKKNLIGFEKPTDKNVLRFLHTNRWAFLIIGLVALGTLGAGLKYLDESAKERIAKRNAATPLNPVEETAFSRLNPFLPSPLSSPTPQLAKEYIYVGSRLLAVEDANATVATPADLAIWRPSTGVWWVMGGQGSQQVAVQWGITLDKPVPGDYDGDGKTDFSVFRIDNPATPENECQNGCSWYVQNSSNSALAVYTFGLTDDQLAPADYDGDGKTDPAVFRNGTWYILRSSDGGATIYSFGLSTDAPAPADYDGDGKADFAVWREGTQENPQATFYVLQSSNSQLQTGQLGQIGDAPVPADYDGDGKADYAVRSAANWKFLYSSNNSAQTITWQQASDKAVQNDYDGDSKVDIAVWRESTGTWYIRNSSDNSTRTAQWGMTGDIPVPAFYRR